MIKFVKIRYAGFGVPKIARRKLNVVTRGAWRAIGAAWHDKFAAKHFTHAGAREYKYAPRQGQRFAGDANIRTHDEVGRRIKTYTAEKLRRKRHTLPLVWSGRTRRLARFRTIVATKSKVRVSTSARVINFKNDNTDIDMRKEFQIISKREERKLVKVYDRSMTQGFRDLANEKIVVKL